MDLLSAGLANCHLLPHDESLGDVYDDVNDDVDNDVNGDDNKFKDDAKGLSKDCCVLLNK